MFIKSGLIHSDILSNVGVYTDRSQAKERLTVKYHHYFLISYVRKVMKDAGERHVVSEPRCPKIRLQSNKIENVSEADSKVGF